MHTTLPSIKGDTCYADEKLAIEISGINEDGQCLVCSLWRVFSQWENERLNLLNRRQCKRRIGVSPAAGGKLGFPLFTLHIFATTSASQAQWFGLDDCSFVAQKRAAASRIDGNASETSGACPLYWVDCIASEDKPQCSLPHMFPQAPP